MDKTLEELLTQLADLEKEIRDTGYERDCLKRERDNLLQERDKLQKRDAQTTIELNEAVLEIDRLKRARDEQCQNVCEEVRRLKDENERLSAELEIARQQSQVFFARSQRRDEEIVRLQKRNYDIAADSDEQAVTMEALGRKNEALRSEIIQLSVHVQTLQGKNERLKDDNDCLEAQLRTQKDLADSCSKTAAEMTAAEMTHVWVPGMHEIADLVGACLKKDEDVPDVVQHVRDLVANHNIAKTEKQRLQEQNDRLCSDLEEREKRLKHLYAQELARQRQPAHPDKATEDLWRNRIKARMLEETLRKAPDDTAFRLGSYGNWFKNRLNDIWPDRATLIRVLSADQSSSGQAEAVLANPEPSDDRSRQGFSLLWLHLHGFPHVVSRKLYWIRATEHHAGQWSCTGTWLTHGPFLRPPGKPVPICHTLRKRLGLGKGKRYTIEIIGPVNPETGEFTEEEPDPATMLKGMAEEKPESSQKPAIKPPHRCFQCVRWIAHMSPWSGFCELERTTKRDVTYACPYFVPRREEKHHCS